MRYKSATSLAALALLVSLPAQGEESPLYSSASFTNASAYRAAKAAYDLCVSKGYLAAVTVADRSGLPLVVLRDKLAGFHTIEISAAKARIAASFRSTTTELAIESNPSRSKYNAAAVPAGRWLTSTSIVHGGVCSLIEDQFLRTQIAQSQPD